MTILQSHVTQREDQLKVAIKQNEQLKVELQRMHQKAQENIHSQVQDETLAHLEAEKEQLHLTLSRKNDEIKEIANRLQETGSLLQIKTEQLDNLATDLDEARRLKVNIITGKIESPSFSKLLSSSNYSFYLLFRTKDL